MKLLLCLLVFALTIPLAWSQAGGGGGPMWNAPDRGAKVATLIPGRRIPALTPQTLYADWTKQQVERWSKDHPALPAAEAYKQYAAAAPSDAELTADFPRHINPFARVRSGKVEQSTVDAAFTTYCPLCGSWGFGLTYDDKNWYHARTNCCNRELWGRESEMPADYALRPTEKVRFQHLDDTVYEDPCTVYRDKQGVEWELFVRTVMDHRRWLQQGGTLAVQLCQQFEETADPVPVHKLAVLLDLVADTYYGLPLGANNTLLTNKDGTPFTRKDWQAVQGPAIFELSSIGSWGRRMPHSSPGWLNMMDEHIWVEPFARVRHHPAFKEVSRQKYGDPEALDRKIMSKLIGDLVLMFKTAFSQKLLTNYQEANYVDLWLLGLLAQDATLIDFAGPAQEVAMYNHTYQDGLNGEGAPNYQAMPGGYFYPYLADPKGWLQYYPKFLEDHPFYYAANGEMRKLTTVRGLQVEWGDQHEYAFPAGLLTDPQQVRQAEQVGSRNWAGYGVGIMRLGGPGHRQELCLDYTRATLHNAQDALTMECWFDGVPVIRNGGYAAWWSNARLQWDRPEFAALKQMGYPKEIVECPHSSGWSWDYAHSVISHNGVTADDTPTGAGWGDNRGYGEVITFKGGEAAGEPGSGFQVLDVRDHYSWSRVDKQVSDFRRTLIGIEGPEGRPYVLDLLKLRGGSRHTLYNSAVADRAAADLPPAGEKTDTLARALLGDKPTANEAHGAMLSRVTDAQRHGAAPATWGVTWQKDAAEYAPRDPGGKPLKRPWPEEVGRVRMRFIGLTPDGKTELVSAKGPWIGWLRQPLPGGAAVNGNVAFAGARDFLVERREAPEGAAASLFAHVIEGYREGEQSAIKSVTPLPVTSLAGPERDLVAVRLTMVGGHSDTVVYQSEAGKVKLPDGTETDARYALLRQDAAGKVIGSELCRGTYLRAGDFGLNTAGDFTGTIVDVDGDLTGTRQQSALIIRPDKPWPAGQGLYDRQLLVRYESDLRDSCNEGWRIKGVTPQADGTVRVEMQDAAPFAVSWHQVTVLPEDRPNVIRTWRPMVDHGNNPWYNGLKLWFPERNKLYTIKRVNEVGGGYGGDTVELVEPVNLAAEGIKLGDWYVIYGVRPGLKVTVANDFCLRREPVRDWSQYVVSGTGDFTVKWPEVAKGFWASSGATWSEVRAGADLRREGAAETKPLAQAQAEPAREPALQLVVGKPAWLNLNDDAAPAAAITLDGKPLTAEQAADLGWVEAPKTLAVQFADAGNPLDVAGVKVTFNAQPVPAERLKLAPGEGERSLRVEVDLAGLLAREEQTRKHRLEVLVADRSVARRETRVDLAFMVRKPQDADAIYLSDLTPLKSFAHGGLQRDRDYVGNPAEIAGRVYPKCLTLCPEPSAEGEHGEATYAVPGDRGPLALLAEVGVSSSAGGNGSVVFMVQTGAAQDGPWETVFTSPVLRGGQEPVSLEVPLKGVAFVRLYTTSAQDGIGSDHALWGAVRFKAAK